MNLFPFIAAHKVGSSALGGLITGALAAEVVAPTVAVVATDFTGMSALLIAAGSLVGVIGVFVVNLVNARTARKAQEAKDRQADEDRKEVKAQLLATAIAAQEAKAMGEQVKLAVDGQTSRLVAAVEAKASAEGQLQEKEKQAERQAVPESPKLAAAQAIIDRSELKEAVAAALKEALAGMPQFASAAPATAPRVTIEKVVADNVDAKTVNTETLNTGRRKGA